MKKTTGLYSVILFLSVFTFFSCGKKGIKPDISEVSKPSSIYNLRRVQLVDGLTFGKTSIPAIVTSNRTGSNTDSKLLIVQSQNEEAAIAIRLSENFSFEQNDKVLIDLSGASLKEENGDLVLENLPASQISVVGESESVRPKSTTIAELLANAGYWGPIVVRLDKINIEINSSGKLDGDLEIDDEIASMTAHFAVNSVFADIDNPGHVESLIGLPLQNNGGLVLFPRSLDDLQIGLSELLEDFEQDSNTNYDSKQMNFVTGVWTIDGGITASTASDPKNGKQSIRLQGTIGNSKRNGIISMEFDLKGVKTISISHGIYPASAEVNNVNPTVFAVEMSKDGGATYTEIGTGEIDVHSTELKTNVFDVNAGLNEEVRFRVVNTSIPFANNNRPRINIDDILFKF